MDDLASTYEWAEVGETVQQDYRVARAASLREAHAKERYAAEAISIKRRRIVGATKGAERFADTDANQLFQQLCMRWKSETAFLSNPQDIVLNPNYQRIIGLGRSAIPLILRELKESGGYWFWALRAISGVDPVPVESRGRYPLMRAAWLEWADSERLI